MLITTAFKIYMGTYLAACALAFLLLWRERKSIVLLSSTYRQYLFSPWRLLTFAIAAISMTVMAPYTGDPTWDYVDAGFMSILTFLTAPWAIATIFLALKRQSKLSHTYIAVCLWLLSVSWSYDVYILLKYDYYPPTWASNLVLSSVLYIAAGLMWNLQKKPERGVIFGFMEPGWPNLAYEPGFRQVFWFALPIMLLVTAIIAPFLF